jgi:ferredoxin-NADP reductase
MAEAKHARVVATQPLGPDTRLVDFERDEPLGFRGGQFLIFDTGQVQANGKALKRAYSLLSSDAEQGRFQIAVKHLPGGPCSTYVHELGVGDEVRFTGPWGKLYPPDEAHGRVLLIATDTGVTATLGLVASARLAPLLAQTSFLWLRSASDYFVPDAFVRARVPAACAEVRIDTLPPIGHPERVPHMRALLAERLAAGPVAHAFVAGDGAVNYALLDDLVAGGVPATRDSVESFFNMPKKSL